MSKLLVFLKFILIILVCFGLTFVVVWPLWKFATALPTVYSITVLVLLGMFILFTIIKAISRHGKK